MIIDRGYEVSDEERRYLVDDIYLLDIIEENIQNEDTLELKYNFKSFDTTYWIDGRPTFVLYTTPGKTKIDDYMKAKEYVRGEVKRIYSERYPSIETFIDVEPGGDIHADNIIDILRSNYSVGGFDVSYYRNSILDIISNRNKWNDFFDILTELSKITIVFISRNNLGQAANKNIILALSGRDNISYQYFRYDQLLTNVLNRTSYIEKMDEKEELEFIRSMNISKEQLPLIKENDTVIKVLGYEDGDIIKEYRLDGTRTRNPNLYYRKVTREHKRSQVS